MTDPSGGRSLRTRLTAAAMLLAAAFACDYLTGNEISSSLFYVVAITAGAWFLGRAVAITMAPLSAAAWIISNRLAGQSLPAPRILYTNLAVELGIYLIMALAVARARIGLDQERFLAARLDQANRMLDRETHAVGDLQRQLLPQAPPEMDGYVWQTHYATSTRAGGDYYDFFPIQGGGVGILLADASGHGAPAAVLMAMTRVLLHREIDSLGTPGRALDRLNDQLAGSLPQGWFVTAFYAVLDPPTGRLEYALAGHDAPLLVPSTAEAPRRLQNHGGFPLGLFPKSRYDSGLTRLEPGDTLVLYTDGVTDAMSPDEEPFGEERLREALVGAPHLRLEIVRERLLERVLRHTAGAPLSDDLTLLLLRRVKGAPARGGSGEPADLRAGLPRRDKGRGSPEGAPPRSLP